MISDLKDGRPIAGSQCAARIIAAACLAVWAGLCTAAAGPPRIEVSELSEISGLAASLRTPGRFWVHNDSGHPPRLYALDGQAQLRQVVELRASNRDWEDIASFRWQNDCWLAIADTGANFGLRRQSEILLLHEPLAVPEASSIGIARRIVFDYPDGMRDVEAMAVDAEARQILLLEKIRPPAVLYALQLDGPERQRAQPIATLPDWWPEPPAPVETIGDRRYRGAPTAMDLSPDGHRLAVLTPTHWMVFTRATGEDWRAVLQRQPRIGRLRSRAQPFARTIFEAMGWDAQNRLRISGEDAAPPLLTIDPDQP